MIDTGEASGRRRGAAPPPPPPMAIGILPQGVRRIAPPVRDASAPPAPPRTTITTAGGRKIRRRRYVPELECQWHWNHARTLAWGDVHLREGWHLNPQRIPVPAVPLPGRQLAVEIARRRRLLPPALYNDPAYAADSPYWEVWLKDEHEDRRHSYFGPAPSAVEAAYPALPDDALWLEEEVAEDDDDPEMRAAYEASNRSYVEEQIRCWEAAKAQGRADAAAAARALMPPPPPYVDPDEVEPWHYAMAREQEQDLPPPPLPDGVVGQSWVWTGGSWSPDQPREEDQPPPPPPPPQAPQEEEVPAHLWTAPPYIVLDDD